jgi:hypothetical protein
MKAGSRAPSVNSVIIIPASSAQHLSVVANEAIKQLAEAVKHSIKLVAASDGSEGAAGSRTALAAAAAAAIGRFAPVTIIFQSIARWRHRARPEHDWGDGETVLLDGASYLARGIAEDSVWQ